MNNSPTNGLEKLALTGPLTLEEKVYYGTVLDGVWIVLNVWMFGCLDVWMSGSLDVW